MTAPGLAMLLLIVIALLALDIGLWLRLRRDPREPGSQDDAR